MSRLILPRRFRDGLVMPQRQRGLVNPYIFGGGGGGPSDPSFASVVFLCHWDGTNGSTTITDSSGRHTINCVSPAALSTAQKVFGTASGYTDGTDNFYTDASATSSDWIFGTGQFTVEQAFRFDVLPTPGSGVAAILSNYLNSSSGMSIQFRRDGSGDRIQFTPAGDSPSYSFAWTPTVNTWYRLCLSRDGSNNLYCFIDGTQIGATQTCTDNVSHNGAMAFGCLGSLAIQHVSAYFDETRITKGVCRHTAGYTLDAAAFPDH